jgi:hypothetical protein
MRVKFLQAFRGVETNEVFYEAGQEVDLPAFQAERLLKDGRCEIVPTVPVKPVEVPQPEQIEPVTTETAEELPAPAKRQRRKAS